MTKLRLLFSDRIQVSSVLIVLSLVGVLVLGSQSASSFATYVLALLMLFSFNHWRDVFHQRIIWIVFLLLGWLTLSSLWSTPFAPGDLFSVTIRALLVFFFVVAFAECQSRAQFRCWVGRAVALSGAAAALAAMIYMYDNMVSYSYRLKGFGQLDNPVVSGIVFSVVLLFALERIAIERSAAWRAVGWVGAPILILAVVLTGSRSAWTGGLIGSTVFLCAHLAGDRRKFLIGIVTLGLIGLVIIIALLAVDSTRGLVLPRGDSSRLEIWGAFFDRMREGSWIYGLGITTDDSLSLGNDRLLEHPHSLYFSVVFQGGLVAFAFLCVLIYATVHRLLLEYANAAAKLALGILGVAIPVSFLDGHELVDKVGDSWYLFWLPISVALGIKWRRSERDDAVGLERI